MAEIILCGIRTGANDPAIIPKEKGPFASSSDKRQPPKKIIQWILDKLTSKGEACNETDLRARRTTNCILLAGDMPRTRIFPFGDGPATVRRGARIRERLIRTTSPSHWNRYQQRTAECSLAGSRVRARRADGTFPLRTDLRLANRLSKRNP